jgi:2-keto-4-pentenoate hydratase/2-oxohepta-3-ene-1,7-dioic acid hydratase in catechol pathway
MPTYACFETRGKRVWGIVEGQNVRELLGGLFDVPEFTGQQLPLQDVKLRVPCQPLKILAVGQNYISHLGERKRPDRPEMFYKPISCLQDPDGPIELPADSEDAHYEGELVVVIGRTVRNASREEAAASVFGITCGNDVSDRNWQRGAGKDVQYWRAKGCDTFGPLGPVIVTGLDYSDLLLTTRVNGVVAQQQRTSDLIFDVPTVIAFVSRYVTLDQGDVIYTGTPGNTRAMKAGDIVEVEIEGIGTLRNPVVARK